MGDGSRRTRVFISYSRKDIDFVEKLSAALAERGYFADFDLGGDGDKVEGGIAPGDQWATRLKEMIIAADAFVLVVSPNSASSPVCDWEIDEAQKLAERIIPVIWRRVDLAGASQRLAALHVALTFEPRAGEEHQTPEAFGSSLESLVKAIDTDIGWLREHSRLTQLASRWSDNQRPEAQLLRTGEITAAELWAARRPPNVSEPPELLFEFLAESRKKEEHDRAELERSEHNARLQAADAWFERALVHLKSAERHHACECLLRSVEVASPNAVPSWFSPTLSQQGWAGNARTLCGCLSPGLPRLIARYALEKEDTEQAQFCCWIDSGNSVVLAHGNELRAYDIHEGSWTPGGRLAREGRVMALAGARAAARACALYDTREIILLDLAGGDTLRFYLSDDVARAAIAIGDAGDELLLVERRGEKVAVRIVRWGSLERTLEIEIPLDDPERKDLWAGFSADSREIGVIAGACLHVFGRDGTLARKLALRNLTSHYSSVRRCIERLRSGAAAAISARNGRAEGRQRLSRGI
jgi:hypothetical protein